MAGVSRRELIGLVAASTVGALAPFAVGAAPFTGAKHACRVRTITAGIPLTKVPTIDVIEPTLAMLGRAKTRLENAGYEVQTLRITTTPLAEVIQRSRRDALMDALVGLDSRAAEEGVRVGVGSVLSGDVVDADRPAWAAELVARTRNLNFSISVATPRSGPMPNAASTAARTMHAIAKVGGDGLGNFRFAASANVPPGTPFFPVGYHDGSPSVAIGLESAGIVGDALAGVQHPAEATRAVAAALGRVCRDVENVTAQFARDERVQYLGIDPSPAPALDRSIGAALETLIGGPLGKSGSLEACAAVTSALRTLDVRTCGYAGLMLPVPEDPRLAQRTTEGRIGVGELLLYSSVCGTGLDCIPLAGDTPVEELEKVIRDVAALATRWQKALAVRVLLVPGKRAGEMATFDDPFLTDCQVMKL